MNIKPISDLRNYNVVLRDCKNGAPVFLTKNGRGKYVIMDAEQYDAIMSELKLLAKVAGAEERIANGEAYMDLAELRAKLGV